MSLRYADVMSSLPLHQLQEKPFYGEKSHSSHYQEAKTPHSHCNIIFGSVKSWRSVAVSSFLGSLSGLHIYPLFLSQLSGQAESKVYCIVFLVASLTLHAHLCCHGCITRYIIVSLGTQMIAIQSRTRDTRSWSDDDIHRHFDTLHWHPSREAEALLSSEMCIFT